MKEKSILRLRIGKFLRELRKRRGMTQGQVAKELGPKVDQGYISRLELGSEGITLARLNLILSLYGLTQEEKMEVAEIMSAPNEGVIMAPPQYDNLIGQLSALSKEAREKIITAVQAHTPLQT